MVGYLFKRMIDGSNMYFKREIRKTEMKTHLEKRKRQEIKKKERYAPQICFTDVRGWGEGVCLQDN